MESEANLKILLPVFEIKKEWGRQAESPGSWEEEEEGSGEEKGNQPFKFKYTGPPCSWMGMKKEGVFRETENPRQGKRAQAVGWHPRKR